MNYLYAVLHALVGIAICVASFRASTPQEWFSNLKASVGLLTGYYSLVFNWYYNKNPLVYAFVNRYVLFAKQTHTFWNMSLEFAFESRTKDQLSKLLAELEESLLESNIGKPNIKSTSDHKIEFVLDTIDGEIGFVVHVEECCMMVFLDRKLTVPLNAYADYQKVLLDVAEKIQFVAKPDRVLCNIQVYFRQGKTNPFYGFFVNRIPAEWLETFHVVFKVGRHPDCRIEADTNHVGVQANSLNKLFSGLKEVLTFQALPSMKEAV